MKIFDPYKDNASTIQEYLEDLFQTESFRNMEHAGAEIPNYILPFPIKKREEYKNMPDNIAKRMFLNHGISIKCINLYDEMLELIGDDLQGYFEAGLSKQELYEDFSNILDLNDNFAPHIASLIDDSNAEIILLTGVGEAYPFIRIHSFLEALPTQMHKNIPIVVFYPGAYDHATGNSCLKLFNKLSPVNYYRAFNIFTEVK